MNESLVATDFQAKSFIANTGLTPYEAQAGIVNGSFKRISNKDCTNNYATQYNTRLRTIVLMADRESFSEEL
jgi:hypothetical protein